MFCPVCCQDPPVVRVGGGGAGRGGAGIPYSPGKNLRHLFPCSPEIIGLIPLSPVPNPPPTPREGLVVLLLCLVAPI